MTDPIHNIKGSVLRTDCREQGGIREGGEGEDDSEVRHLGRTPAPGGEPRRPALPSALYLKPHLCTGAQVVLP